MAAAYHRGVKFSAIIRCHRIKCTVKEQKRKSLKKILAYPSEKKRHFQATILCSKDFFPCLMGAILARVGIRTKEAGFFNSDRRGLWAVTEQTADIIYWSYVKQQPDCISKGSELWNLLYWIGRNRLLIRGTLSESCPLTCQRHSIRCTLPCWSTNWEHTVSLTTY